MKTEIRYHVNPETRRANICRAATVDNCPLKVQGAPPPHFPTKGAAREFVELIAQREAEKRGEVSRADAVVGSRRKSSKAPVEDVVPLEDPLEEDEDLKAVYQAADTEEEGCENCGEEKTSVRPRRDPYEERVHGNVVWRDLCQECLEDLESEY